MLKFYTQMEYDEKNMYDFFRFFLNLLIYVHNMYMTNPYTQTSIMTNPYTQTRKNTVWAQTHMHNPIK
jgi:hypothetical protein